MFKQISMCVFSLQATFFSTSRASLPALYVAEKKKRKKRKTRGLSVSDSTTRNSLGAEDLRAFWDLSLALRTRPADSAAVSQNAVCGVYSADPMAGAPEGQRTTKDSLARRGWAWTSGYAGLMGTLGQRVGVPEVTTVSGISRIRACRFMYLFIFGFFRCNFGLTVHSCVNTVGVYDCTLGMNLLSGIKLSLLLLQIMNNTHGAWCAAHLIIQISN